MTYWIQTGFVSLMRGDFDRAREAGETAEQLAPRLTERDGIRATFLAIARGLQQDSSGARSAADEAVQGARAANDMVLGPQMLATAATAYLLIGDHEAAADVLLELSSAPAQQPSVATLELSPVWEGLRASPEYPAVLAAFEAAEAEGARRDTEAGY
jgi:hypothetical protein